ncbi:hypothetical protein GCM10023188_08840 [Pontibacter saemangeumensis]|uniref:SSU ribosomal protein S31P n=1 Tax=Pontibacter saemangeumensis TaxID=1084525 RepID=A0ABP8LC61_9BACT
MGKGDVKSRKGKITKGTYGNRRPRAANKKTGEAAAPTPPKKAEAAK